MIRREESLEYHGGARPGKIELRAIKPCLSPREMRLAYLPGAGFPSAAIAADPQGRIPLHLTRQPRRGRDERLGRPGSGRRRTDRREADAGGDRDSLQAARRHRRVRPGARHARPRRVRRNGPDVRPDFRGDQPEGSRRPGRAPRVRPALGRARHPRLPREPLQHRDRGGGGSPKRARSGGKGDLRRPRGDLRRRNGGHRLRAAAPAPRRRSGTPSPLRRARAHSSAANGPHRVPARVRAGVERAHAGRGLAGRGRVPRRLGGRDPDAGDDPQHGPLSDRLRPRHAGAGDRLRGGAGEPARRDRGDQPRAGSERRRRSPELPLRLPRRARRAGDADHRGDDAGRGPLAGRPGARGRHRGGEPRLRRRERSASGRSTLLPKPIDPRILVRESAAVAAQAIAEGVARRPPGDRDLPGEPRRAPRHRPRDHAPADPQGSAERKRVVFPEGTNETVLRACHILEDEGIATPDPARRRGGGAVGNRASRRRPGRHHDRRSREEPPFRGLRGATIST